MGRIVATLALLLCLPAVASAAGGPAAGAPAGGSGVVAAGSPWRFVTVDAGPGGTVVLRIARLDGRVEASQRLPGHFMVPAAAIDGAGTGASVDGRTLVLSPPRVRFPVKRTRFEVLDGRSLRSRHPIRLRGDFTLDAISPDGRLLYLVEYTSRTDITKYVVRAYDLATRTLRPKPVVDPDEADEPMRGMPLARTMSPDGRWAYTLYDGAGTHPFVHALDTARTKAVCVDLDALGGRDDLWNMKLRTGPAGAVVVDSGGETLLSIDPHTFAVRRAATRTAAPRAAASSAGPPGTAVGAALVLLLVAAAGIVRGRARRG